MSAREAKKGRRGLRILRNIVLVIVILIAALLILLPTIVKSVANSQLPKQLHTDASIEAVKLSLFKGLVRLEGLKIAQPEEFGEGYLLDLPSFAADVAVGSLLSGPLTVENVELRDTVIHLVRNADGKMNTEALATAPEEPPAGAADSGEEPAEDAKETEKGAPDEVTEPGKPIRIANVNVQNVTFSFTDYTAGDEPFVLTVTNINLALSDLLIDAAADAESVEPGKATLTAVIIQNGFSNAYIGAETYVGPVGGAVPAVNAQVRLVGLELKPLGSLIPPGTGEALGGSAFDTSVKAAVSESLLDVSVKLDTIANHTIALNVGGTPDEPEFDKSALLFNVFGRGGGTVVNVAGNVTEAGMATAGATLKTAGNLGKDTGKAVANLGKGLFGTVKNVAKGDVKGAAKSLGDTGKNVVTDTAGAVTDTGKGLAEGVGDAGKAAVGGERAAAWRSEVWTRWTTRWPEAQQEAAAMPYPPERLGTHWETDADFEKEAGESEEGSPNPRID